MRKLTGTGYADKPLKSNKTEITALDISLRSFIFWRPCRDFYGFMVGWNGMHQKIAKKVLRMIESWLGVRPSLGQRYRIVIKSQPRVHRKIKFTQEKKLAKAHFVKRLTEISTAYDISYNMMRISSAKTRWGSCSRKRNINLNWRLIFAPPGILDYVIIHELSHLTHMNHSKVFWAYVERMMPEYKTHRTWLKKNGSVLSRTTSILPSTLNIISQ